MKGINQTTSILTHADRWDHVLARCGYKRSQHLVEPGLYSLGAPDQVSPVFVTANYTLSFDALRAALNGLNSYILVLDTQGINVWCAAGKGTFGTNELISKVRSTGLKEIIDHKRLIVPQLGAAGVSAPVVKQESGFEVEYGPVQAEDLPEYLKTHQATSAMRTVRFNLIDRLTLVPVELKYSFLPMVIIASILAFLGGWFNLIWVVTAWLAAGVGFLVLLPALPTKEFSTKGLILGMIVAIPFVVYQFAFSDQSIFQNLMRVVPMTLITTALVTFFGLNLTGTTPITNWTGVRREIFKYIPLMAVMFGTGIVLIIMRAFGIGR